MLKIRIVFVILFDIIWICSFHDRCSSNCIPEKIKQSTRSHIDLPIFIVGFCNGFLGQVK